MQRVLSEDVLLVYRLPLSFHPMQPSQIVQIESSGHQIVGRGVSSVVKRAPTNPETFHCSHECFQFNALDIEHQAMPPGEATYRTSWKYCGGIVPELVAMIDFAGYAGSAMIPEALITVVLIGIDW